MQLCANKFYLGPNLLTWINFNHTMDKVITSSIKCGLKVHIQSQTSTAQQFKFGNEYVISSHTLPGMCLLINIGKKMPFEISHKILNPYIVKYAVYWFLCEIYDIFELRGECLSEGDPWNSMPVSLNPLNEKFRNSWVYEAAMTKYTIVKLYINFCFCSTC